MPPATVQRRMAEGVDTTGAHGADAAHVDSEPAEPLTPADSIRALQAALARAMANADASVNGALKSDASAAHKSDAKADAKQ